MNRTNALLPRIVSWFSAGAASAVATKLAILDAKKNNQELVVAYCEVIEEHPDNKRFLADCETWFGKRIQILGNDKYDRSIYKVFEKTRYLAGIRGARCTRELKKQMRHDFQKPDDNQIMGYTVEEQDRIDKFIDANNEVNLITPLIDRGLTKDDCIGMIQRTGIEIPIMYKLGYKNNNCRGCVKASSPKYWQKIKIDFPKYWQKMNDMEKHLNRTVVKIDMATVKKHHNKIYLKLGSPSVKNKTGGSTYWRPQLHEIPKSIKPMDDSHDIQCGIFCELAQQEYS